METPDTIKLMKVRASLISILLITALGVWGSRAALQTIRAYSDRPPDFDEAVHLLPALQIANDVRALRVSDFWLHTFTQDRIAAYPFLHSWLLAPFFIVWKPALTVARASGLFYLVVSAIVAFFLARELSPHRQLSWLSGLTGALLTLAAMPLWAYASLAFLEAPGLLVTLVGLLCYIRAGPGDNRPGWLIGASVSTAGMLFTKYSFGVFMVTAILVNEVLTALVERRAPSRRRLVCLAGPFVVLALAWFADPNKLYRFLIYSQSQRGQFPLWSSESLLYYPKNLIRYYASGPLSAVLVLTGLATGLIVWKQYRGRTVLVYFLISMVAVTLVPQKAGRFLYTVAPAAFVLAGPPVAQAAAWLTRPAQKRWVQIASALLIGGLLVIETRAVAQRFSFYEPAIEVNYTSSPDTRQAYRFIADNTLARGIRPLILNGWHLVNAYALEWEYYSNASGEPAAFDYGVATTALAPEPTEANLSALTESLARQGITALVSIDGSPAGPYTGWQVIEPLLSKGELETHPDHPRYTLIEWASLYVDQVFAGDFSSQAAFEQARRESKTEFPIQLHLYYLK
jgi:hypothetical protein